MILAIFRQISKARKLLDLSKAFVCPARIGNYVTASKLVSKVKIEKLNRSRATIDVRGGTTITSPKIQSSFIKNNVHGVPQGNVLGLLLYLV